MFGSKQCKNGEGLPNMTLLLLLHVLYMHVVARNSGKLVNSKLSNIE